jgi:hypothetical protein
MITLGRLVARLPRPSQPAVFGGLATTLGFCVAVHLLPRGLPHSTAMSARREIAGLGDAARKEPALVLTDPGFPVEWPYAPDDFLRRDESVRPSPRAPARLTINLPLDGQHSSPKCSAR